MVIYLLINNHRTAAFACLNSPAWVASGGGNLPSDWLRKWRAGRWLAVNCAELTVIYLPVLFAFNKYFFTIDLVPGKCDIILAKALALHKSLNSKAMWHYPAQGPRLFWGKDKAHRWQGQWHTGLVLPSQEPWDRAMPHLAGGKHYNSPFGFNIN